MPETFETLYQAVYKGEADPEKNSWEVKVPWDIAEAQPCVEALELLGAFSGEVIDIGCGLGNNSHFLASQKYQVTGVDISPTAIGQARERAQKMGVEVDFSVADATSLTGYENRFDRILDSGLYHSLVSDTDRRAYISATARVSRPGARLNIFCFSSELPEGWPQKVTEQNLREIVAEHWTINSIDRTYFKSSMTRSELHYGIQAAIEVQAATVPREQPSPLAADGRGQPSAFPRISKPTVQESEFGAFSTDEQGLVYVPVWHLTAHRS
jgi:SAM-dependent methyltransferase